MPSPRDPCNLGPPLTTLVRPQAVACEVLAAAVDAPKKKKQKKQQPNAPTERARKAAERVALTAAKAREQAAELTVAKARTAAKPKAVKAREAKAAKAQKEEAQADKEARTRARAAAAADKDASQFVSKIFKKVLKDLKKEGVPPPTASKETADASSMLDFLKGVAMTFVEEHQCVRATRVALLAPLLALTVGGEPPAPELLELGGAVRGLLHGGFTEGVGYQEAEWQAACSASYFSTVGVVPARRLSQLALATVSKDVRALHGAHAHLDIFWLRVYRAFTSACYEHRRAAVADMPAAHLEPLQEEGLGDDRQVMGVVGGWAVFSLRADYSRARAAKADAQLVPLLDQMGIKGGADSSSTDPAVLYLLARQRFGGLTAIPPKCLDFFNMAQNVMHTFLTPECIRTHAGQTFQKGVDAINCNPGIAEAFDNIFDAKTPKDLIQALRKPVLTKFFNQAAAEFCRQLTSWWGSAGGREGTGIRTKLKVLQQTAVKSINEEHPHGFTDPAAAMELEDDKLHLLLSCTFAFSPHHMNGHKVTVNLLKTLLKAYDPKALLKGKKSDLIERLGKVVVEEGARLCRKVDPVGDQEGEGREQAQEEEEEEEEHEEGEDESDAASEEGDAAELVWP